ncbi:MAG: zinc ABC transporter ATP-binding protein ZnuC [Alphaproteobacteria bacterium]|nr:zinc ABC transporter ATP-binding protein ZnuC [Alphaproteobacteria bacterium]MBO6863803.1 zinc ABC transporter ATP-binding protein ZnuC [Alphaproteobacteria bacterium]
MPNTESTLLTLNNAGVLRAGRWLVRGVTMKVDVGEIVTLIGPNGSGKSTTAKMALGLLRPDEGGAAQRAGLRISYVPQKLAVDWTLPLTVRRFMFLTGGVTKDSAAKALAATGMSHLVDAEVRTLSGGEFQRVMLARAMARQPDLLVLDEPVQGVDFTGEIAIYDLIKQIRDELNCGVLLISHDLHVVMAATDRVVCLNGHVCCSGTPTTVASSPEYKALFGARAASALAVYEHHHDHTHLADGRVMHADGTITDDHGDHGHDHGHGHDHPHRAEAPAPRRDEELHDA